MSNHYGEDATSVRMGSKNVNVTFTNKATGAVVRLTLPLKGSLSHKSKKLTIAQARGLGDQVAHILRQVLD